MTERIEGMGRSELIAEIERLRREAEQRGADQERLEFLGSDWTAMRNVWRRGFHVDRPIRALIDEERRRAAEAGVRVDPRASQPDLLFADEDPNAATIPGSIRQLLPPPAADTLSPPPAMSEHVVDALAWLLLRIGGWTHSQFQSHVRYEFGDEVGDELEAWLEDAGVGEAIEGIARTPANDSVSAWRVLADPKRRAGL